MLHVNQPLVSDDACSQKGTMAWQPPTNTGNAWSLRFHHLQIMHKTEIKQNVCNSVMLQVRGKEVPVCVPTGADRPVNHVRVRSDLGRLRVRLYLSQQKQCHVSGTLVLLLVHVQVGSQVYSY